MLQIKSNTRGWSLVASIIALVVMLLLGTALLKATTSGLRDASRKEKESRALGLAEAGVEHMLWRLYEGTTSPPATIVLADLGGTITTTARPFLDADGQPVPECVQLDSAGEIEGWTTAVRVGARYLSTATKHNPIFDYALFSDNDLTLSGETCFDHHIHSNGSLQLKGGVTVGGHVEAAGNMRFVGENTVTGDARYGGAFKTTGGTTIGGDVVQGCDDLPMPTIDLAYYQSEAVQIYHGDTNFSSTTTLPDGVIYVDGDLHLAGEVQGTGTVVVNGNVTITGSTTYGSTEGELAIISTGQVSIGGGATIYGLIYAHNVENTAGWTAGGEVTVYGAVIADTISSEGALTLNYRAPDNVSLPGDNTHPTQIALFSWEKIT